jgi:hypothetical protein
MQNLSVMGTFGPGQNPQGIMMYAPPNLSPSMMQMMQPGVYGLPKHKNDQTDKSGMPQQGLNSQNIGQSPLFGGMMNMGPMLGGGQGLTPEMIQQLNQATGGSCMLPPGMFPSGLNLSSVQPQNSNSSGNSQGQSTSGGMAAMLQNGQMNPNGQNYSEMMRQQQYQQLMML